MLIVWLVGFIATMVSIQDPNEVYMILMPLSAEAVK